MKRMFLVAAALACGLFATVASAQTYPAKVVRVVVPFPPGGGFDGIARPIVEKMSTLLGQPLVLDYKMATDAKIPKQ